MAFNRPTLIELIQRIENDVQNKIVGSGAPLRRSIVKILSRAMAGVVHTLHGFLDWTSRQLFVTTAEDEQLDRHGLIWGIDRKPATFATGIVQFTGTDGNNVPVGTKIQNDAGIEYETTEIGTITLGVADVPVQAILAGTDANTDTGVILNLLNAVPFIDSEATVLEPGILGGSFVESDEEYRERILFRIQSPPQGGAANDYIIWATDAQNVTDAWVFPTHFGAGTVLVTVANYNNEPPIVADLTEVEEIIEVNRPVTADVTVLSVIESLVNLTISLTPNTQAIRDNVTAEIKELFKRRGVPGGTVSANNIGESIGTSAGVDDYTLDEIIQDGNVVSGLENSVTQVSVLNNINFVSL